MEQIFHNFLPIPKIELFPGRTWTRISGISHCERRLEKEFRNREIPYYIPREHHHNEAGKISSGKLLFPGNVFAAIQNQQEVAWLKELSPGYNLHIIESEQEQLELHADLRFMKFAERLSGAHRFTKGTPKFKSKNAIDFHDETGNGCM